MSSSISNSSRRPGWWLVLAGGLLVVFLAARAAITGLFPHGDRLRLRADPLPVSFGAARFLFTGTSQTAFGVAPDRFPQPAANLTIKGFDYVMMERALRRVLPVATNLQTVVVEAYVYPLLADVVATHNGDYKDLYAIGLTVWNFPRPLYWKCRQRLLETALRPFYFYPRVAPAAMAWTKDRLEIPRFTDAHHVNGHVPSDGVLDAARSTPLWLATQRRDLDPGRRAANAAALERLVRDLRGRGLRVVLLKFPVHASYREQRPAAWAALLDDALRRAQAAGGPGVACVDWEADPAFGDAEFQDAVHLNSAGAAALTARLAERLAE